MALSCFINDVEYKMSRRFDIREQVGQPSFTSIEVKLESNPLPVTHTLVELKENGSPFYCGLINNVDTPIYSTTFETDIVPLQLISFDTIFTRRLVSGVFTNKNTHEIVTEIFNEYLVEEGLTLGTIEVFDRLYENYVVPNLRMSDVFQELGDDVGAVAKISVDKVFSFVSKNNFPTITPPTKISRLRLSESGQDLKTIQRISGAKAETSLQTKVVTWVSGQTNILLGYQLSQEPSITIDAVPVEVGQLGIDDNNVDKTFLWAAGNNTVVLNDNATVKPDPGDIVSTIFRGFYNIDIISENEDLKTEIAGISGTSGKIESILIDTSITSETDGESLGDNLLAEKGQREKTVTLMCKDITSSSLLNSWPLNYPDLNIQDTFIVVERTIRDFVDDEYMINVKLKNRGFYSRYGTSFNKNTKEINNLSVRTDDLILKTSNIIETIQIVDEVQADQLFMEFTPGTTDIFSPLFFDGITPSGGPGF